MIPDFEFFLKMRAGENIGHHALGFLIFDIPVGLLACFAFHYLWRDLLIENAPNRLYKRLNPYLNTDWFGYAKSHKVVILGSLILGVLAHLFVDEFTREDGFFVEKISFLRLNLPILSNQFPIYLVLQILLGIIVLVCIYKFLKGLPIKYRCRENLEEKELFWLPTLILAGCIFSLRMILLPKYAEFWDCLMAIIGSLIYSSALIAMMQKIKLNITWEME